MVVIITLDSIFQLLNSMSKWLRVIYLLAEEAWSSWVVTSPFAWVGSEFVVVVWAKPSKGVFGVVSEWVLVVDAEKAVVLPILIKSIEKIIVFAIGQVAVGLVPDEAVGIAMGKVLMGWGDNRAVSEVLVVTQHRLVRVESIQVAWHTITAPGADRVKCFVAEVTGLTEITG